MGIYGSSINIGDALFKLLEICFWSGIIYEECSNTLSPYIFTGKYNLLSLFINYAVNKIVI